MLTKLPRAMQMVRSIAKLPFVNGKLIEAEEAIAFLGKFSPDGGGSCYLSEPVCRERRVDLSVIIPTYNNEQYVGKCVQSVLDQETGISFEVIVVNDGSTDGSRELLERSFGADPRVRLVHQNNMGHSGARNTGIDLASGDYLMFLDADDNLLPGAVARLMATALEKDASIVCGGYTCRLPNGKKLPGMILADEKISPMGRLPGYVWGKVYKASVFDHLRFPMGYWFQDSISAQIIWPMNEGSFYTIKEPVYEYLINPQGISVQSTRKPKALDSLWLYLRLLEDRKQFGLALTQEDYEHFLEMVKLTYVRTRAMDNEVKKCIFAVQRQLKQTHFASFASNGSKRNRAVEKVLVEGQYKKYALLGELPL